MRKIEIDVSAGGCGSIKVDGKEISNMIAAANVKIRAGKLTTVYVALVGDVELKVDGEVLPVGVVKRCSLDGRIRTEKREDLQC